MGNTIIYRDRSGFIELIYHAPASWIVRHWTKFLWFKKLVSSNWFIDEHQALAFAKKIERRKRSDRR